MATRGDARPHAAIAVRPVRQGRPVSKHITQMQGYDPNFYHAGPGVAAYVKGSDTPAAHIEWAEANHPHNPNAISMIKTHDPALLRHGIPTALYDWAKTNVNPDLKHSVLKTDLGKAWAAHEEGRTAGLEDNDPLWELLGLPPGGRKPSQPSPSEPSPPPDPDRYYKHLIEQPDRTHTAHAWLPTDVVDHYREYDRPTNTPDYQAVKRAVSEQGVKLPLWISANDTHGLLVEGNNRLQVAKELGIPKLPVRFTHNDPPMSNEGNSPVPHHPVVKDWLAQNRHRL